MGESFKKLKIKTLMAAIIKSAVIGLSCGLFAVSVLMLAFKFSSVEFFWAYYIPIGVGAALIAGGLCFFVLRPTDKKIAAKYDAEFGLNEKLQTMVEYSGNEDADDIITLQRQDTLEKLAALPKPKFSFALIGHYAAQVWQYVAAVVVAVSVGVPGIYFYTVKAESVGGPPSGITGILPIIPDENDDGFEYTLAMQSEMDDLINAVRDSALDDGTRLYAVERLTELSKKLVEVKLKSEMQTEVYGAVKDIDELIVSTNSFQALSTDISEADENLSNAIIKGFVSYKGRLMNDMPQSYMNALRSEIGDYIERTMEAYVTEAAKKLLVTQLPTDGSKNLEDTLTEYTAAMDGALTVSTVDEEDALYDSFKTLNTSLTLIRNQAKRGGTGDSILWGRIWQDPKNEELDHDGAFNRYTTGAVAALGEQSFKCIAETFVRQRLADIFKISFNGLEELYAEYIYIPGDDPGTGDDPGGGGGGGGGIGTGEIIYGSNDLIYDPRTGQQVPFGEVLKEYENAIIAGTAEEDFPPELAKYLETYLNYLHNGTGSQPQ